MRKNRKIVMKGNILFHSIALELHHPHNIYYIYIYFFLKTNLFLCRTLEMKALNSYPIPPEIKDAVRAKTFGEVETLLKKTKY